MSILEIEILFHYRCYARDYRDGDFNAPADESAIDQFLSNGMLTIETDPSMNRKYRLTERANFYVDAICSIPMPVATWIIPKQEGSTQCS